METTCSEAQSLWLTKLGLFGTRFTMQAQFYPDACTKSGIVIVVPHLDEQILIHERYTGELLPGVFRSETRKLFLNMVVQLNRREDFED
jgi:aspartate racemase